MSRIVSVENINGKTIPHIMLPIIGSPSNIDISQVEGTLGIIRVERITHLEALVSALSRIGCIPDNIDYVIIEEFSNDERQAQFSQQNDNLIEKLIESSDNVIFIYDMEGIHDSIIPASTFTNVKEDDNPAQLKFVGNLHSLACSAERANEIEDDVLDLDRITLVRQILTDRIAVRDDISRSMAKRIFECFLIGRLDFPLTEEEVNKAFKASAKPYLNIFDSIDFADTKKQKIHDEIVEAEKRLIEAMILWDWSLKNYGCPFTINEWRLIRQDKNCWKIDSMREMAHLIGVDVMLDALFDGIPLDDLIA